MEDKYKQLSIWLQKYYEGLTNPLEERQLMAILQEVPDEILEELLAEIWEGESAGDQLFNREESALIFHKIRRRISPQWISYWRIAAAILAIGIVGAFVYLQIQPTVKINSPNEAVLLHKPVSSIKPGENTATFISSTGEVLELKSLAEGESVSCEGGALTKTHDGIITYSINDAAQSTSDNTTWNLLKTPRGGQYQVTLPDDTHVWLNANSSISFPTHFSADFRQIKVSGEVYFEVSKNVHIPFEVIADKVKINVLGTSFNVSAYSDDKQIVTTLLEGSVKIETEGEEKMLKPGEQASLSSGNGLKISALADPSSIVAWKNGFFQFNDSDVADIMRQIARWYNVSIRYEGKVPIKKLTGSIGRNVELKQLLDVLVYSGIRFKIQDREIIVTEP